MRNRMYTTDAEPNDMVTVAGQIHEVRNSGGIAFLIPQDTSSKIQARFEKDEMDDSLIKAGLDVHRKGAISVTDKVDEEPCAPTDVEVTPESLDVIAKAEAQLPLDSSDKVDAEFSTRLDNRALDLRKNEARAIFEIRAEVQRIVRNKFHNLRATETNMPRVVTTGTEGGTELFPITYFGQEVFMNQSPQLFKQLMIGSEFGRVFEVGPIFRAKEYNTPRHLSEATSTDFESVFIGRTGVIDTCKAVVAATYETVEGNCQDELEALGLGEEFEAPSDEFPRSTYEEAIRYINATGELDEQLTWGGDFPTEGEKVLGENIDEYYLITDWSSEIKPLYIKDHGDGETLSTGSDMMCPNMEFISGGQCEHYFDHFIAGFEQQGLDPNVFEYCTKTFKYSIPSYVGFGFDGERLVMTMLGLENIREAVLFLRGR